MSRKKDEIQQSSAETPLKTTPQSMPSLDDRLESFTTSTFRFACDYITIPAKFFLSKAAKVAPLILSAPSTVRPLVKRISKQIVSKVPTDKKKMMVAAFTALTLIRNAHIVSKYNPWYYGGCVIAPYVVKKIMEKMSRDSKDEDKKSPSAPIKFTRTCFNNLVVTNSLGSVGVTIGQYTPIFFLAKPLIEYGLDKITDHIIEPTMHFEGKVKRKIRATRGNLNREAGNVAFRTPIARRTRLMF